MAGDDVSVVVIVLGGIERKKSTGRDLPRSKSAMVEMPDGLLDHCQCWWWEWEDGTMAGF